MFVVVFVFVFVFVCVVVFVFVFVFVGFGLERFEFLTENPPVHQHDPICCRDSASSTACKLTSRSSTATSSPQQCEKLAEGQLAGFVVGRSPQAHPGPQRPPREHNPPGLAKVVIEGISG